MPSPTNGKCADMFLDLEYLKHMFFGGIQIYKWDHSRETT